MRGFIALHIIIFLVIIGMVSVGYYVYSSHQQTNINEKSNFTPTLIPTPTIESTPSGVIVNTTPISTKVPVPLIDCVGPDGKHVSLAQKACDDFKKAWATPTPSPTLTPSPPSNTQSSSGCDTNTNLATLTVNIQPASGQSIIGDTYVSLSNGSGACAGIDSRLPDQEIVRQGSTSINMLAVRPGVFHIDIGYHGVTNGYDVSLHSGSNSFTATVSN